MRIFIGRKRQEKECNPWKEVRGTRNPARCEGDIIEPNCPQRLSREKGVRKERYGGRGNQKRVGENGPKKLGQEGKHLEPTMQLSVNGDTKGHSVGEMGDKSSRRGSLEPDSSGSSPNAGMV